MNTCETCKHWWKGAGVAPGWDPERWGVCGCGPGKSGENIVASENRALHTTSNFGCILHEPKEVGD